MAKMQLFDTVDQANEYWSRRHAAQSNVILVLRQAIENMYLNKEDSEEIEYIYKRTIERIK